MNERGVNFVDTPETYYDEVDAAFGEITDELRPAMTRRQKPACICWTGR